MHKKAKQFAKRSRVFLTPRRFMTLSLFTLGITTVYWSLLGAVANLRNADQLADPALFSSWGVLNGAIFPSQHTFLLKWPLFWIVQLAQGASWAFILMTVLVSVATVAGLAFFMSKLEQRPYVLGTLLLALAASLLLIPIEPKAGALLPVNIAMLATRNIEYLFFIFAVYLLISLKTYRPNKWWGIAAVVLVILFASDQLFVGLSLGAAVLLYFVGLLSKRVQYKRTAIIWFGTSLAAVLAAIVLLLGLDALGFGTITTVGAGPYSAGFSLQDKILALVYAGLGTLTTFGANPVYDTVVAKDLPNALVHSFTDTSILAYLINFGVFLFIATAAIVLFKTALSKQVIAKKLGEEPVLFSTALITASLAAVGLFVLTSHYYAVDARYLAILFFAGFIALATWGRVRFKPKLHLSVVLILLFGIAVGIVTAFNGFQETMKASNATASEDQTIAAALRQRPVKRLLADYWRAYPITQQNTAITPVPLQDCTTFRDLLTSTAWQKNALNESFAYLLTTTPSVTGFPGCSLQTIRATYGSPSDSIVITGTPEAPRTVLLFYDNGVKKPTGANKPAVQPPASNNESLVRNLGDLDDTACQGRTVVQVVAHQDDDLLFMSPDLQRGLDTGDCIRSIYLTAGDAGTGEPYWISREEGAKAAYAKTLGIENPQWMARDVRIGAHMLVKVAVLKDQDRRVSLLFLRLPDGNLTGQGFSAHDNESLSKLVSGSLTTMHSVDGQSYYTKPELEATLLRVLMNYKPALVRTQATRSNSEQFADHSDHIAVGRLTGRVFTRYVEESGTEVSLQHFLGYPVRDRPVNVEGDELLRKKDMFYTYGSFDGSVCTSDESCSGQAYSQYLGRQYIEE